jgi:hypothetical protein
MKYGKLFREFIKSYDYTPSQNKCSLLSYKELKEMAKLMYPDIKEACNAVEWNHPMIKGVRNPLNRYTNQSHKELINNVYKTLTLLFN